MVEGMQKAEMHMPSWRGRLGSALGSGVVFALLLVWAPFLGDRGRGWPEPVLLGVLFAVWMFVIGLGVDVFRSRRANRS